MKSAAPTPELIAASPRDQVIHFLLTIITVAFALAVSDNILDGRSLVWPASGVALFWMLRANRPAMAGTVVAMALMSAMGGAASRDQFVASVTQNLCVIAGIIVCVGILRRLGGVGTLTTTASIRHFLSALGLSAVVVAIGSAVVRVVVTADPAASIDGALKIAAMYSAGVGMVTPPLIYFSQRSVRVPTVVVATGIGIAAAAATCALRVQTPTLIFAGFLVLPLVVAVAIRGRTEATMAMLVTSGIALAVLPLLIPNFHYDPVVVLSFTWSVGAASGAMLLYLAASLEVADFERRRQRDTWKQLGLAMAAANDRIWDWDAENEKVWVENPASVDDADSGVLMGIDNWMSEIHPEDATEVERQRAALLTGESDRFECEHRVATQELTWRWVSTRGSVIDRASDGSVRRVIGTSRDISTQRVALMERQALETRMAQSQRLESLGVLAGGVAHDFNNLLLAILTNLELTIDDDNDNGSENEALIEARDASLRARELCAQLLSYAGQRPTALTSVQITTAASDMRSLLRASIAEHIALHINLDGAPPVLADLGQLRQVIMNLVINAAEAIGEEMGEIIVRAGTCTLEGTDPDRIGTQMEGDVVFLEIVDDGPGMDPYVLDRLFDPFFTTKFQGRGLGMAAVLGIVRAHQGAAKVLSRKGRGTTVRVFLRHPPEQASAGPASREADAIINPSIDAVPAGSAGHVIIADDEPAIRRTLARAMSRRGYNVVLCEDGVAALEAVKTSNGRCDLLIMDVVMPRLTGRAALPKIREAAPDLNVILMSGYDENAGDSGALDARCSYLQKPFSLETLDEALRHARSMSRTTE